MKILKSILACFRLFPVTGPVRLTLNAKAINGFRVSLKRVYFDDKLQGASDENALHSAYQAKWAWTHGLHTPCALSSVFTTPNELPYVTSAKEWERLSSEEFWIHGLLSESCRFNKELAKAADTKDDTKYQSRGVINMQATTDVVNPALPHSHYSKYTSTSRSASLMSFSPNSPHRRTWWTCGSNQPALRVRPKLNHYITLPDASMPHAGLQRDVWSRLTEPGSSRPHLVHV